MITFYKATRVFSFLIFTMRESSLFSLCSPFSLLVSDGAAVVLCYRAGFIITLKHKRVSAIESIYY